MCDCWQSGPATLLQACTVCCCHVSAPVPGSIEGLAPAEAAHHISVCENCQAVPQQQISPP